MGVSGGNFSGRPLVFKRGIYRLQVWENEEVNCNDLSPVLTGESGGIIMTLPEGRLHGAKGKGMFRSQR